MASNRLPLIGITMGDPCGIGPEGVLRALGRPLLRRSARFVVLGSSAILRVVARRFDVDASFLRSTRKFEVSADERVAVVNPVAVSRALALKGEPTAEGGRASGAFVEEG